MIQFFSRLFGWGTPESDALPATPPSDTPRRSDSQNYSSGIFKSPMQPEDDDNDVDDDYREPNPNYTPMDDYDSYSSMSDPDYDYD